MSYVVTRDEIQTDRTRFMGIQVTDELGVYNFGRWLTAEQSNSIISDPANLTTITDSMAVSARANKLSEVPAIEPNIYDKLDIRRAMRKLGNEDVLDTLLSNPSYPTFAKDWADAPYINLNDSDVVTALAQVSIDIDAIKIAIEQG